MIGYLTSDLLFQSRVVGAAKQWKMPVIVAPTASSLCNKLISESAPSCIFIDLTLSGLDIRAAVEELRCLYPQVKIIAYGPHVAELSLQRAREANCDLVLTRGQFDRSFQAILQNICEGKSSDSL